MNLGFRPGLNGFSQRVARRWREVASTLILDIISLGSLLVIFPLITRGLGPDQYGEYIILYLVFGLIGLWIYAGPSAALVQLIMQLDYDTAELLRLAKRQVYVAGLVGGSVGTAIGVALLGWDLILPALMVLVADFIITSLANLNLATVYAVEGIVRSSRTRIILPLLRAPGVVALALWDRISIVTLISLNITASVILLARSAQIVRRRLPPTGQGRAPTAKVMIGFSSYYSTTMSTNSVQNEGEKFILAMARPALEVGQYAAAYRVVSTSLLPLGALIAAANRWFMVPDDREGAHRLRALRLTVPTVAYGVVAGIGIVMGRDVIERFAGSEFDDAGLIAVWLCALPLLHGLAELPPMGLLGLGRNRERMLMGLAASAVAIVSYLVLVPLLGWRGAVLGTYISEIASIVIGWALLVRYQRRVDAVRSPTDATATP